MASRIASTRSKPARKATNVSLDADLIAEARALDVNISRACEQGLAKQIADARAARWLAENEAKIEAWNTFIAEHDLPLAKYRMF